MAAGTSPSIAALPGGGYEVAFQANGGHLWLEGSGGTGDTNFTMMAGTSPALAELPPENNPFYLNGGPVAVFQGSDGHPWFYSAPASGRMSDSLFMAPGTSPAVAPLPGGTGTFQALWQGSNNHLWTTGAGPTDTGFAMMAGTSPALAELPAENNPFYLNGGPVAVFQGGDGHPWFYSAPASGSMSNSLFMAPGTSPAVVPLPGTTGTFQALWQGTNNHLWTTGAGPTDTGFTMMAGTSPNMTALS
jgi:hypothetical protein